MVLARIANTFQFCDFFFMLFFGGLEIAPINRISLILPFVSIGGEVYERTNEWIKE